MRTELRQIIERFRRDQELALNYLHARLRIPVPMGELSWAAHGRRQIEAVASTAERDGATLRKHGIGIEIIHPVFQIDFDYGPDGECDCFDSWRLQRHEHVLHGYPDPVSCHPDMRNWLAEAASDGHLRVLSETRLVYQWPESLSGWTISSSIDS